MSSSSTPLLGWELTFKSAEAAITQKSDVVIVLIHWILILELEYKCLGLGSEKTISESDKQNVSDLLPDGWNQGDIYQIRYTKNDTLYILTGSKSNDIFVVNFLFVDKEIASNIVINIEQSVLDTRGPITKLFANHTELIRTIKAELIDYIYEKANKKEKSVSPTVQRYASDDPLRVGPPRMPPRDIGVGYGYNDLNPFGGGGGMLFDPTRQPSIGSYPGRIPGARFDPFAEPDHDHFRPPTGNRNPGNPLGYPDFI